MHYGEPNIRKAVPLALGLLSASNPQLPILDTLSKYSHDNDLQVALNAIFAMGLVGAGSNNARLAQMLRQLAGYYHKEPDCLFMVRIAQGLVHMGKGTMTVNPFCSDRSILCKGAVAGLMATLLAFTDAKGCEYFRRPPVDRLLTFLRSRIGQVSLDVVLLGHRDVSEVLDHPRRGSRQSPCISPCRTSELGTIVPYRVCAHQLFPGSRRGRTGRQAAYNLRFPDSYHAGTSGNHRTSRACYRGIHFVRARLGRFRYSAEKSRL